MGGGDGEHKAAEPTPDQRILVEVAETAPDTVADHLVTTGTLESEAQADIVPEATGAVTRILVEEGDAVSAGQLLALVANPSLEAGADRAKQELERARRVLKETEALHAQGAVSDQELRTARDAVSAAQTSKREATAARDFTRITSPIEGTIALRELRVGELAGGKRAFQVVDLSRLRVVVQLPEKDLARISLGQTTLMTSAYDEDARATGRIARISPVVDPMTGTVRVRVALDPDQSALRPGQFVKVRIEVGRHDDVLTIPRRALLWTDGQPIAWQVIDSEPPEPEEDEEETDGEEEPESWFAEQMAALSEWAEGLGEDDAPEDGEEEAEEEKDPWEGIPRREVSRARLELGFTDPDRAEIVGGLESGALVIVSGNTNLRDGALVRLPDDPIPEEEEDEEKDGDEDAG